MVRVKAYRGTEAGKNAVRVTAQRQREKHPERYAARQAVLVAIRSGRLVKEPCSVCGAAKAEAHHLDYAKPLDVHWLCQRHHREVHAPSFVRAQVMESANAR